MLGNSTGAAATDHPTLAGQPRAPKEETTMHDATPDERVLRRTAELAGEFLRGLDRRPVGPQIDPAALRSAFAQPLPDTGEAAEVVIDQLVRDADPGLVAVAGPRYFGFVIGGHLPAALAADWLTSTWDQNAVMYVAGPSVAVVEETAGQWLLDLLGLPVDAAFGFTTGATMANFTGLAAARHRLLAARGWDVDRQGLFGAPAIDVIVGAEVHASVLLALQYLGLGRERIHEVPTDEQGRMRADLATEAIHASHGPVLVCVQAGNVNTGAFDPIDAVADAIARRDDAWLHVDGAFGLWAAASPGLRHLVAGAERADSWATDAHKWLNVPYDSGFVACADPDAYRAAMSLTAAYLMPDGVQRDGGDWVPEMSRRARGVPVYAALRSLGRQGVRDLVERCCRIASRMADRLREAPGVEILNDVVLDQVVVRFAPPGPAADETPLKAATRSGFADPATDDQSAGDAFTRSVVEAVQREGTCWLSGTTWHGTAAMRISVVNATTTEADADRSVEAILSCARSVAALPEWAAEGTELR
jgi:glutamate/tyrosine decarboxylase-like PLP-dependent enzyme